MCSLLLTEIWLLKSSYIDGDIRDAISGRILYCTPNVEQGTSLLIIRSNNEISKLNFFVNL